MKSFKIVIPLITLSLFLVTQTSWAKKISYNPEHSSNPIQIKTKLSQTKLVQHSTNKVFLDITFTPPTVNNSLERQRATDMIIVLDRSGSMSEAKKMPFAKAAIRDILSRLHDNDRFALVSFADNAMIQSHLVKVTANNRSHLNNLVRSIHAVGGTNIGAGLNTALKLLNNNQSERAGKILLLSDGQANQGITHPEQLAQLASSVTQYGAVLSSIGMGLGFNENLLSKLADYGMGHYSYLEDLSGLHTILARDLQETRNIYANSSTLEINLGNGVKLIDAGGYPITHTGSSTIRVTTGQLLSNTDKHFIMTLSVPTGKTGSVSLANMHLNYQIQGQQLQTLINSKALAVAIVAPEQRIQAQQSIDKKVFKKSWVENNLGRMKKNLSKWMREGKKDKAKQEINTYRQEMKDAATASNMPLASAEMEVELKKMNEKIDDAFAGSSIEQKEKRNRAAKSIQYESIKTQRKNY